MTVVSVASQVDGRYVGEVRPSAFLVDRTLVHVWTLSRRAIDGEHMNHWQGFEQYFRVRLPEAGRPQVPRRPFEVQAVYVYSLRRGFGDV